LREPTMRRTTECVFVDISGEIATRVDWWRNLLRIVVIELNTKNILSEYWFSIIVVYNFTNFYPEKFFNGIFLGCLWARQKVSFMRKKKKKERKKSGKWEK
jgi:hypothetical protein